MCLLKLLKTGVGFLFCSFKSGFKQGAFQMNAPHEARFPAKECTPSVLCRWRNVGRRGQEGRQATGCATCTQPPTQQRRVSCAHLNPSIACMGAWSFPSTHPALRAARVPAGIRPPGPRRRAPGGPGPGSVLRPAPLCLLWEARPSGPLLNGLMGLRPAMPSEHVLLSPGCCAPPSPTAAAVEPDDAPTRSSSSCPPPRSHSSILPSLRIGWM